MLFVCLERIFIIKKIMLLFIFDKVSIVVRLKAIEVIIVRIKMFCLTKSSSAMPLLKDCYLEPYSYLFFVILCFVAIAVTCLTLA